MRAKSTVATEDQEQAEDGVAGVLGKVASNDAPRRKVGHRPARIDADIHELFRLAIDQNFVPVVDDRGVFVVTADKDSRSAIVRASAGPWETLSTSRAGSTLTVQIRALADGTAQGLLSRWNHAANPTTDSVHRLQHHLPAGARVLRRAAGAR